MYGFSQCARRAGKGGSLSLRSPITKDPKEHGQSGLAGVWVTDCRVYSVKPALSLCFSHPLPWIIFLLNLISTIQSLGITCLVFILLVAMVKTAQPIHCEDPEGSCVRGQSWALDLRFCAIESKTQSTEGFLSRDSKTACDASRQPTDKLLGLRDTVLSLHMCLFACERISHMSLKSQVLVSEVCSLDYTPKLVWKAVLGEDARRGSEIPNSFIPALLFLSLPHAMCASWLQASSGDSQRTL